MQNLVLYTLEHGRKPLLSVSLDDRFAAAKISARCAAAYADAEKRGVPHPDLKVIQETREADEAGRLTRTHFVEVDPSALKAIGKEVANLEEILPSEKRDEKAPARVFTAEEVQKMVSDAVAAQSAAMQEQAKSLVSTVLAEARAQAQAEADAKAAAAAAAKAAAAAAKKAKGAK